MFECVNTGKYELNIKKSVFIAFSYVIDSRDEAKKTVDDLKREYADATHVCSGYISDEKGDEFGYDDDGEPSGTAGKPIYAALDAAGVRHSLIAVVRYFGGIKLGAGGLTRAYRQAASELILSAGTSRRERYSEYTVRCDNGAYKTVSNVLKKSNCITDAPIFNEKVTFTALCPQNIDMISILSPLGGTAVKNGEKLISIGE